MFGVSKSSLLEGLEKIRKTHCRYMGPTCDCKYGADGISDIISEQSGCPEIRQVQALLNGMTDMEFGILAGKSHLMIFDDGKQSNVQAESRPTMPKESIWDYCTICGSRDCNEQKCNGGQSTNSAANKGEGNGAM